MTIDPSRWRRRQLKKSTWIQERRWLLGGLLLAALALAAIVILWAVQAHQYQLALAHFTATHQPITILHQLPDGKTFTQTITPPGQPPVDNSNPAGWGWIGWTLRLLAILVPALAGIILDWQLDRRHRRQRAAQVQKAHLEHATSKLAEAIVTQQSLPEGVFDAYSKLRELDPDSASARSSRAYQGPKRS